MNNKKKEKNQAAVALSKLGASKGGFARASKLSEQRRRQIAKKAAEARWYKSDVISKYIPVGNTITRSRSKKTETGIIDRMEILNFEKELGENILYRKTGFKNALKSHGARFNNCSVKMDDLLREGFGKDKNEALVNLAAQLSEKVLIFYKGTDDEYSIDAPPLKYTAL